MVSMEMNNEDEQGLQNETVFINLRLNFQNWKPKTYWKTYLHHIQNIYNERQKISTSIIQENM